MDNCEICGQPIGRLAGTILEQDSQEKWHIYCSKCAILLKTCQACPAPCEFETNPDPLPKVVIKTVRQGNMQMQTQVMNPERVNKFCPTCRCYDKDNGCKKQFNMGCDKQISFWN